MAAPVLIRDADRNDANEIVRIYLRARRAMPYAPLAHSDAEVREWITTQLVPSGGVRVAVHERVPGQLLGFAACSSDAAVRWLDHCYVDLDEAGNGVGAALVRDALAALSPPVRLYTFQPNAGARRFYERLGFALIAVSDGSGNEERCPDACYEWTGP